MARYHINPQTGAASPCRAQQGGCPFGGEDQHYISRIEAQKAYESFMGDALSTILTQGAQSDAKATSVKLAKELTALRNDQKIIVGGARVRRLPGYRRGEKSLFEVKIGTTTLAPEDIRRITSLFNIEHSYLQNIQMESMARSLIDCIDQKGQAPARTPEDVKKRIYEFNSGRGANHNYAPDFSYSGDEGVQRTLKHDLMEAVDQLRQGVATERMHATAAQAAKDIVNTSQANSTPLPQL